MQCRDLLELLASPREVPDDGSFVQPDVRRDLARVASGSHEQHDPLLGERQFRN